MLKECVDIFKKQLDEKGMNLIFDRYIPKDGSYVLVPVFEQGFGEPRVVEIKKNNKKGEEGTISGETNIDFPNICKYDFYSKLLDTNKAIEGKKIIHSISYCSFFVKKESLTNGKLTEEVIQNYYKVLEDPLTNKYKDKKESMELYQKFEVENGVVDVQNLTKAKSWILENIFQMEKWVDIKTKDYLKVIFEFPIEVFEKEFKRYTVPNMYNKNDFNVQVDKQIFGLPNQNMGMNAKKPFLESKSKKVKVPYLISEEDAIAQMLFFEYLLGFAELHKQNIYIDSTRQTIEAYENGKKPTDFSGYFLRIQKGKELEIHSFDVLSGDHSKLPIEFRQYNHLKIKDLKDYPYGRIKKVSKMEALFEKVLFPFLSNNYFTDAKDVPLKNATEKQLFLRARESLFEWFYKGNSVPFQTLYDQVTFLLLKQSLLTNYTKATHQLNLRLSLKQYFEGGEGFMGDVALEIKQKLKEKMDKEDTGKIESDEEYYFAVGQLIYYLLYQSKAKSIPQSGINRFLTVKTDVLLKEKLRNLYMKYNYNTSILDKRFKNIYGMIAGYIPEQKMNQDMLITGFLHSNLFYEKKEENKDE